MIFKEQIKKYLHRFFIYSIKAFIWAILSVLLAYSIGYPRLSVLFAAFLFYPIFKTDILHSIAKIFSRKKSI